jgi:lysophospholipid acyltransferase (LPLAT)-like uncharacterized protein
MIKQNMRRFLYRYLLPYGALLLGKIVNLTYRVKLFDAEKECKILDNGGGLIYSSWHQRFFPGISFFSKRKPIAIIVSRSRDGTFISRILELLGWYAVRGSSSRGGSGALRKVKRLALSGYRIGHIVDGPKGPSGVVKTGLLKIAQFAGIPIVPTIISAQKKWVFNSWDRFMIPKPFSRVIIRFGDPIYVAPHLGEDELEKRRLFVEQRLRELYHDTDLIWTHPGKISEVFT